MNMKILREQFRLQKVKKISGGGLEVSFQTEEVIGQATFFDEDTRKSTKEPHPHLTDLINLLTTYLGKIMNFAAVEDFVKAKDFKATVKQKDYAKKAFLVFMQNIRANGISTIGLNEITAIKILGVYEPSPGQVLAVNPRVRFDADIYGWEADVQQIVTNLETECFEYLFEDKRAQLEIFADNGTEAEKGEPELFDAKKAAGGDA